MASFHRANRERINVFPVEERYLFRHYFEDEDVFDRVRSYYNNRQYRFELPPEEFDSLRSFLSEYDYSLVLVDAVAEFVVVVKKYTDHPDNIFKASVIQRSVDDYNCFLMRDQPSVEQAVDDGATRLTDTGLENPF